MRASVWRRWRWLWITCGWLWISCACSDDGPPSSPPAPASSTVEVAPSDERTAPAPGVDDEVVEPAGDVAEPSERERLEVACFHGSTEACDRLGH